MAGQEAGTMAIELQTNCCVFADNFLDAKYWENDRVARSSAPGVVAVDEPSWIDDAELPVSSSFFDECSWYLFIGDVS